MGTGYNGYDLLHLIGGGDSDNQFTWTVREAEYDVNFDVVEDELDGNVFLTIPVPGATKEDIEIEANDDKLSVVSNVPNFCVGYTYTVPKGFILKEIDAEVENGILTVKLINGKSKINITIK